MVYSLTMRNLPAAKLYVRGSQEERSGKSYLLGPGDALHCVHWSCNDLVILSTENLHWFLLRRRSILIDWLVLSGIVAIFKCKGHVKNSSTRHLFCHVVSKVMCSAPRGALHLS